MPIQKKGWKEDLGSYRAVSLTSVLGKLVKIILSTIMQQMQDNQAQPAWVHERQVLPGQPDLLLWQGDHLVDEGNAGNVSMWTSVKPLTASPTAFSRRNWLLMAWMGALLPGLKKWMLLGPRGCWWMEWHPTGQEWCSPGLSSVGGWEETLSLSLWKEVADWWESVSLPRNQWQGKENSLGLQ